MIIRQPNMGKKVNQEGGNSPNVPKPMKDVGGNSANIPKPNPSVQISGNTFPGYTGKRGGR